MIILRNWADDHLVGDIVASHTVFYEKEDLPNARGGETTMQYRVGGQSPSENLADPALLLESISLAPRAQEAVQNLAVISQTSDLLARAAGRHLEAIAKAHGDRSRETLGRWQGLTEGGSQHNDPARTLENLLAYVTDRAQRMVLSLDALRERGDIFIAHEEAGCPPVLIYDYEIAVDGATLPRPCNYMLLKIKPQAGVTIDPGKRPYIIIDPRAGHGAGIGGFKFDSQVGVAMKHGHPVYFVAFRRAPVPGQTLADVTRAEATFVRHVQEQHSAAPKPVVIGNCQGGWGTLVLGASNPDITGPLVLNGAPVSAWSGRVGENPMRYNGGLLGGEYLTLFWSDIGGGIFDGAWLVQNFEQLNPSRNFIGKYYDLFAKIDTERPRFLDFERWWGGFFLLTEAEISWIVREIFVGNRLARNEARLEHGRSLDIKKIQSPIIVFASFGDNITPPQQALNWIVDTYADENEIRILGQRIVYMVHEKVGHLGIFVSASIAKREHTEVTSTLEIIEALPPGLYEMVIESVQGEGQEQHFTVSFAERTIADISAIDDGRTDETPFAAVARLSQMQADFYDVFVRPFVQAMVTPATAQMSRTFHPLRLQRSMMSSSNPAMAALAPSAEAVNKNRMPARADNPFVVAEKLMVDGLIQAIDFACDARDAAYELAFFNLWANPAMRWFGRSLEFGRTRKSEEELANLPEVLSAMTHMRTGGFVEAVIRMLVLLAGARGNVRRDRLERSTRVLTQDEPFASIPAPQKAKIVQEQTLIVRFGGEEAIEALHHMLPTAEERERAAAVVQYVPGPLEEMEPHSLAMLQRIRKVLGLPAATEDVMTDPLANTIEPAQ